MDDTELAYRIKHPNRPRVYDIATDAFKDATQRDIDLLMRAASNWGGVREAVETLAHIVATLHQRYMDEAHAKLEAAE